MNSTALRAPSRLSLTALLFGLLLPFGALAEEAAPTAQAPVATTEASAQADTTQALPATPALHPQAEALKELLKKLDITLDVVANIEVPRQEILNRLTTRRTCVNTQCQAIYNVRSQPPKVEGVCDKCGSPIVQRDDETEEAISKRLDTYDAKTAPLIDFYRQEGLLLTVDSPSSEGVMNAIIAKIKKS